MQIKSSDIIVKFKKDSNKTFSYQLDDAIFYMIKAKKPCLKKLYGDLNPKKTDIVELAYKVLSDFCLDNVTAKNCPLADNQYTYKSYVQGDSIFFGNYHYKQNNIEVVLHEIAHIICDKHFYSPFEKHGALFVSVLKWLVLHYELLTEEEFYFACEDANNSKIKMTDESIISIDFISGDIQSYVDLFIDKSKESSYYSKNGKKYIENLRYKENGIYHILQINYEKMKAVLVKRKLFGYEDFSDNIFSKFTNEDLNNFHLISPVFLINYNGYRAFHRYEGEKGYTYYQVDTSFVINKSYEFVYDLKDYQSQIKCLTKKLKKEGIKYKRCSTYEEFKAFKDQLSYEINKRKNNN